MKATIETDKGKIILELFENDAPNTVKNFSDLAKKGYYDGLLLCRPAALKVQEQEDQVIRSTANWNPGESTVQVLFPWLMQDPALMTGFPGRRRGANAPMARNSLSLIHLSLILMVFTLFSGRWWRARML